MPLCVSHTVLPCAWCLPFRNRKWIIMTVFIVLEEQLQWNDHNSTTSTAQTKAAYTYYVVLYSRTIKCDAKRNEAEQVENGNNKIKLVWTVTWNMKYYCFMIVYTEWCCREHCRCRAHPIPYIRTQAKRLCLVKSYLCSSKSTQTLDSKEYTQCTKPYTCTHNTEATDTHKYTLPSA